MKTTKRAKQRKYESAPTIKKSFPPPTEAEIRRRAHQIFLSRGGIPGRELEDWLLAEKQIFCERIEEFERQSQ
jgi:hypothetical protein